MIRNYKHIILLIIAVIIHETTYSQDSLSYYLEQAAMNNPGVKARYLEYTAALDKAPQAASLPDPQLQFGYFIKPMELLGGNQVADLTFMQMFPWFGTLKAAKDEASKMAMAKFENFRDARNELYFNVKSSFYKVYLTMKEIEIAEKNLEILHALEKLAIAKFSSGGISSNSVNRSSSPSASPAGQTVQSSMVNSSPGQTNMGSGSMPLSGSQAGVMPSSGGGMGSSMSGDGKNDMVNLIRVQIEIHDLENRIALLKDHLATDKISFNRYLNRPGKSDVFTGDSLTELPVPADFLALNDSLSNHPMVKMYEAESQANSARLDMVRRMGYPMIGLGVNYMIIQKREGNTAMMNGNDMIMPMVSLTLPIYRKKYKAMKHETESMRDAARMSVEDVTNNLGVTLQQTLENMNDAGRRVELFTGQAALADKSIQLLISSYSAGGTDFVEVLRMQQQFLDYQFKQVEAVVDKNTAIAKVVYLTEN
jgi:outer membrane protein TolC